MDDCYFTPQCEGCCDFTEDLRYLNTEETCCERGLWDWWFKEEIEQFGTEIEYQPNGYSLSAHNSIYGEHTTQIFNNPEKIIAYVVFNSDSIVLNQFGIDSDADITLFIHISSYEQVFGAETEPNAGDLLKLTEYGNTDRPNGRGPAMFEVTRRDDEDLMQINPLLGHYVWLIRAKRFDYSFENNVVPEKRMNQINDDVAVSTGLSGVPALSSVSSRVDKTYTQNADDLSKDIFDYDEYPKSNDNVYGDY